MGFLTDPVGWFWQTVAAAIRNGAGDIGSLVGNFLFATTDVLGGGRPFTEGAVIAQFQPAVVAVADAGLAAVIACGGYHVMFSHGLRSLYTVRILLPRVLLAVVLANVSLPLVQAAIDAENALCAGVLGLGVTFDPGSLLASRDFGSGPGLSLAVLAALFAGYGVRGIA
jgi:hypothetical protein